MRDIIRLIDRLADATGALITPLALVMMLLTCIVVVTRYVFHAETTPLHETVIYLHGLVFMLGISYALKVQGHVRVDIFYHNFSARRRALVDLFGTLFFLLPVAGFIFWSSLDYVHLAWQMKESSAAPDGLPGIYLFKTLIPIMAALLAIQGLGEALKSIAVLLDPTEQ